MESDELRPLSGRGRAAVELAAKKILSAGIRPDIIVASPLLRAIATAETAAAVFAAPVSELAVLSGEYSCENVWRELRKRMENCSTVLAVGHQPGIGYLAGGFFGTGNFPFQPAGFATLRFEGELPERIAAGFAKEDFSLFDPNL